jgi:hypothetical protein
MPATMKDLLFAARAAVPAITPAEAADLVAKADALVVDVRDGTEVAASGTRFQARWRSHGASSNSGLTLTCQRTILPFAKTGR